jgi:hypothetical protein
LLNKPTSPAHIEPISPIFDDVGPNLSDLMEEVQHEPDRESETASDMDIPPHRDEDVDSDFDLDGAFGLGETDDPFLDVKNALFLEMCADSGLSSVLLLISYFT